MSDVQLGSLPDPSQQRDAIHVAVAPVVAAEILFPGQRVGLHEDRTAGTGTKVIGIVDPFLQEAVNKGQTFWLMLLPNTVTGMRHEWQHPLFTEEHPCGSLDKTASENWLREFASKFGLSYSEVIDPHGELVNDGFISVGDNEDLIDDWYAMRDDFRRHYAAVTGSVVDEDDIGGFTCSC